MNAQKILKQLEDYHYWDARMLQLNSNFFGDEVKIVFQDTDGEIKILFSGCSKVCITSSVEDRQRPLKEMNLSQIPYFIQNIGISEYIKKDKVLMNCKILAPPLNVEIVCNLISLNKE